MTAIHRCTVCGKQGQWTNEWGWFGSYKDLDEGKPVVKVCSSECFDEARERGRIPIDVKRDMADDKDPVA